MPDRPPIMRKASLLLGGTYVFVAAYAVVYTWLTVYSYSRIVFAAQAVERDIALRDCRAIPNCAPSAYEFVQAQDSLLDRIITLVRATAWIVVACEVVILVVATVAVAASRRSEVMVSPAIVRFLRVAWMVQAAIVGVLLIGYAAMLLTGSRLLDDTPVPARMLTFDVAFDSPFFDVGTFYYLAWFVVMNGAGIALTRALIRSLHPALQDRSRGGGDA